MKAFANYGFPETHSVSFAYLVYASSWIKHHEPAAFCAALLNAQPMGFWSPHTLVRDARRHGVVVRTPDLNASLPRPPSSHVSVNRTSNDDVRGDANRRQPAVRLGIGSVRGIGTELAKEIEARVARTAIAEDLVRRVPALDLAQLEAMATGGLFGECFGLERREALWAVGAVAQSRPGRLAGVVTGADAPPLPGHVAGGGGRRRPVGHRHLARRPPDAVPAPSSSTSSGVVTSAGLWDVTPGHGSPSPASSPTASAR